MSISDRLLGKKNVNGKPHIEAVAPSFALPGGEVRIIGKSLRPPELRRPSVHFGEIEGSVLDQFRRLPGGPRARGSGVGAGRSEYERGRHERARQQCPFH